MTYGPCIGLALFRQTKLQTQQRVHRRDRSSFSRPHGPTVEYTDRNQCIDLRQKASCLAHDDFFCPQKQDVIEGVQGLVCTAAILSRSCLLWVKRWGNRPALLWIAEDFGCCASG